MTSNTLADFELKEIVVDGYERVVEVQEESSGLHVIIAIHDTTMGPALGGLRICPYESCQEALEDVLRLAEGMTYKSALVEAGFGGGKSVMLADPARHKSRGLLRRYAEIVNGLEGVYLCGKDMGVSCDDLSYIREHTPHVAGAVGAQGSGDPSPFTAWGVFQGIQAAARWLWGSPSLEGRKVAIQGLGGVGMRLADFLFWAGAELIVADIDESRVEQARQLYHAQVVRGGEIFGAEADIFAPCARGGILDAETVERLRCQAVVGGANNQLADPSIGVRLHERSILYAPDFVANAGGLLNGAAEFEPEGYNPSIARAKVDQVGEALYSIYERASREGRATSDVAMDLAHQKLKAREGARRYPVYYH